MIWSYCFFSIVFGIWGIFGSCFFVNCCVFPISPFPRLLIVMIAGECLRYGSLAHLILGLSCWVVAPLCCLRIFHIVIGIPRARDSRFLRVHAVEFFVTAWDYDKKYFTMCVEKFGDSTDLGDDSDNFKELPTRLMQKSFSEIAATADTLENIKAKYMLKFIKGLAGGCEPDKSAGVGGWFLKKVTLFETPRGQYPFFLTNFLHKYIQYMSKSDVWVHMDAYLRIHDFCMKVIRDVYLEWSGKTKRESFMGKWLDLYDVLPDDPTDKFPGGDKLCGIIEGIKKDFGKKGENDVTTDYTTIRNYFDIDIKNLQDLLECSQNGIIPFYQID